MRGMAVAKGRAAGRAHLVQVRVHQLSDNVHIEELLQGVGLQHVHERQHLQATCGSRPCARHVLRSARSRWAPRARASTWGGLASRCAPRPEGPTHPTTPPHDADAHFRSSCSATA